MIRHNGSHAVLVAAIFLCSPTIVWSAGTITFHSLLHEMADIRGLAEYPQPAYRLIEQSSYDRASKSPDDPVGWFANKDWAQWIRVETNNGRKEYVVMEHQGPGALVRVWMPDKRLIPPHAPVETKLRIYFDGANTPSVEGHMLDLFNGTVLAPFPFGHKSQNSAVSYLPIPFSKSCKITLDQEPLYYSFTFRAYLQGTRVRTFSMKELEAERSTLERVGRILVEGPPQPVGRRSTLSRNLGAGENASLDLPAGDNAVVELSLKLGSYQDPQMTRSLVLQMEVDGEQTVWAPVGEFFGTGAGLNPFRSFERVVREDGTMVARWPMPYRKNGRITLTNLGNSAIRADLHAIVHPFRWNSRTMYFHASWRHQYPIPTRPHSDWNYITIRGKGIYVGDTLTVVNPVARWWGEGDEKIWVDKENFPSSFGTGTEDYYGYSWGGRSRNFYEHPFHSQVRVQKYNKSNPERAPFFADTTGLSTETRSRELDRIPFNKELRFDIEVWHSADVQMDYSAATYWYSFPGATSDRKPEPEEAARALRR